MKWTKANIIPAYGVHICKVVINDKPEVKEVAYSGRWIFPEGEVIEYLDESPSSDPAEVLVKKLDLIARGAPPYTLDQARDMILDALTEYEQLKQPNE